MNRKEVTLDIRKLPLFSALTNFCSNNRNQYFKHLNMKKHLKKHTVEEKAKSVIQVRQKKRSQLCCKRSLNDFFFACCVSSSISKTDAKGQHMLSLCVSKILVILNEKLQCVWLCCFFFCCRIMTIGRGCAYICVQNIYIYVHFIYAVKT